MKYKLIPIYLCIVSFLFGCSSLSVSERKEGLVDGKKSFRVFITFEDYEYRDSAAIKKINEKISADASSRFVDFLNGFGEQLSSKDKKDMIELFLAKRNFKSEIRQKKISDERVDAFVDFQIPPEMSEIISECSSGNVVSN